MWTWFDYKKLSKKLFFSVFILIVTGMGLSCLLIYTKGNNSQTISEFCQDIPDVTSLKITEDEYSIWNWKFLDDNQNFLFKNECPTIQYNTQFKYKGKLISRSEGDFSGTTENVYINDCQGNRMYKIRSGLFQIGDYMLVFMLQFPNNDIISYVKSEKNLSFSEMNIFDFKDTNDVTVGTVVKSDTEFKFNILDNSVMDIRAVGPFFVHDYFAEYYPSNDSCNSYFLYVSWITVSIISILFCACGLKCYFYCHKKKEPSNSFFGL